MSFDESLLMSLTVSELAALYYQARETRLSLAAEVRELQDHETALKQQLIASLGTQEGIVEGGRAYRVVEKQRPYIADYPQLKTFVLDRGCLQVFNRALNAKSISEIGDVPGVDYYVHKDISAKKV